MRPIQIAGLVALVVMLVAVVIVYWPGGGDPNSPDPEKRLEAITQLSGHADEESVSTLIRLSRDSEPRVAIAAVKAIGAAPKSSHVPLQRILARPDNSPPVRAEVFAALGKCPKANVKVTVLTEALTTAKDPQVRAGAARGLARRRDRVALKELVAALEKDPDARVRLQAVTAISRTTALRFDYDAWTPPEQQRDKIRIIKETLRLRTNFK